MSYRFVLIESQNDASTIKTSSTEVETPEAMTPGESNPSVPPQELAAPMQPFIPEPEAPIDPAECRQRLLEHIEHFQNHIDSRLTTIEAQVCGKFLTHYRHGNSNPRTHCISAVLETIVECLRVSPIAHAFFCFPANLSSFENECY